MQSQKILLVGCGDIGIPLAGSLAGQGAEIWGVRRHPEHLPEFVHPIAADVTRPVSLIALSGLPFDYVVITLTPAGFTEAGYHTVFVDGMRNLLAALNREVPPKRIFFVSSTSVYQQSEGEWVDETSPTEPTGFSGRCLLQSERLLAVDSIAETVVRFGGIYGPGRRRLIDQVLAGQGVPREPMLYTNRIHRDDCVGVLEHLIRLDLSGEPLESLYLGVDSNPALMWEVKQWLAEQLGVELRESGEQAPARRNSKRVSNRRLLASGYRLLYPGYREGYRAILDAL